MSEAAVQAPLEDLSDAEKIIDLTPYLRRSAERRDDRSACADEAAPLSSAVMDRQLTALYDDSAEAPISEKLAALLAELGIDQEHAPHRPTENVDD